MINSSPVTMQDLNTSVLFTNRLKRFVINFSRNSLLSISVGNLAGIMLTEENDIELFLMQKTKQNQTPAYKGNVCYEKSIIYKSKR